MKELPKNPNFDFLRNEAKSLLRAIRSSDPSALQRVVDEAPHLANLPVFLLANAQFCVAREYGFSSWAALKSEVLARTVLNRPRQEWPQAFLEYAIGRGMIGAKPELAKRLVASAPELMEDPYVSCAVGNVKRVKTALADPTWVNRPGGPFVSPPLVLCTHSKLLRDPEFRTGIMETVELLLAAGADVNDSYIDPGFPDSPLSALYGAAGRVGDADLTKKLLDAGANPDDNESLYHSCEVEDTECMRLLLRAGARVKGTNSLFHCLDGDRLDRLQLLLDAGADPNDMLGHSTPIYWAIYRRRSAKHVKALLDAGAKPNSPYSESYCVLAMRAGLLEVADLFEPTELKPVDHLCALAAAGNEQGARELLQDHPGLLSQLNKAHLKVLPELASAGNFPGVKTLVRLGWPIATPGGDWSASALNLAVFRGDLAMAEFLIENGASLEEQHGYGDNVVGTLRFASEARPNPRGDYLGCAKLLVAHGMSVAAELERDWTEDLRDYFESLL